YDIKRRCARSDRRGNLDVDPFSTGASCVDAALMPVFSFRHGDLVEDSFLLIPIVPAGQAVVGGHAVAAEALESTRQTLGRQLRVGQTLRVNLEPHAPGQIKLAVVRQQVRLDHAIVDLSEDLARVGIGGLWLQKVRAEITGLKQAAVPTEVGIAG